MSKPSILVMAGGTGGHIFRALPLLNIFGYVVGMFLGSAIRMEWNFV